MPSFTPPNFYRLASLMLLLICCSHLSGQRRLNLFIDCECNRNFLKQELSYVNHTVDPVSAEVNLFIVTNYLSNGGRVYNLDFKGQEELAGNQLSFKVSTTAVMTSVERDELLGQRIKLGLAGFLAGTAYGDLAELNVDAIPEATVDSLAASDDGAATQDNWNNWLFEIQARFSTSKESQRGTSTLRAGIDIDRTTPELRVRISPNIFYRTQSVTQSDGTVLNSIRQDLWFNASVVRSISDHWSVGLFNSQTSSTFRNIDYGLWVAPAIEYNIFDYDEVPFKEFTIAYRLGWNRNYYTEETIFFKLEESMIRQVLDIDLRIRQRWGQVFAGISGGNFLNDLSKNRLSLNGRANVRLIKGLSFTAGGSYQIINDQISLRRGEASVEDVLLGQSQLATNFEAELSFGLSYTFGSLYNNVINTRL
ncbi:hypothetical protein [Lewinella sp. 4G2]|uniref:hypothetical protein n=1 Tax=Lewinella sp. 4G2 TaxID=1803372 RepID=UPI0007B4F6E9|nr:hypothetical protein [Lewinella sp. 4G2]OAV43103.1 hypothetical protein A3850_000705 [Lewinella sp. 4G2]